MLHLKGIHICTLISALIVLASTSCKKDEEKPVEVPITGMTLTAVIGNDSTKTSMDHSGEGSNSTNCNVVWNSNDAIAVINNGRLYRFVLTGEGINTSRGVFSLDAKSLPSDFIEGDFNLDMPVQAFYPYEGLAYDPYTKTINYKVPAKQVNQISDISGNGPVTNFGQGQMPMAAYAENARGEIRFKQLFGVLKISIKGSEGEYLKNIEVHADNRINGNSEITIRQEYANYPEISLNFYSDQKDSVDKADPTKIILEYGKENQSISTKKEFLVTLPVNALRLGVLVYTSKDSYYMPVPERVVDGKAEKTVEAGKIIELPEINTVKMPPAYIENGIYLGNGIILPKTPWKDQMLIWAPVNCGFAGLEKDGGIIKEKGYLFGKLYQWGRKDGQGYLDNVYEDATYPYELSSIGNNKPEADKFYTDWQLSDKEWPTDSNPCPTGWRVPTIEELISLVVGLEVNDYYSGLESQWTPSCNEPATGHYGLPGFWFYGSTAETDGNKVFLPAGGFYRYDLQGTQIRGLSGCYWSATSSEKGNACYLDFNRRGYIDTYYDNQACGRSVRCVKSIE